jgi:hypothetical protein
VREQVGALSRPDPRGGDSSSYTTTLFAQALLGSLVGAPAMPVQPSAEQRRLGEGRRVRRPEVPPASQRGGPVGTVTLSVQPNVLTVAQDASFEVRIALATEVPVSHLPIEVLFDSVRLRFDNERSGALLQDGAESETLSKVAAPGRVVLGASRLGPVPGVTGEGIFLRLFFKALQPGAAAIVLNAARPLGPDLVERNVLYSPAIALVTVLEPGGGAAPPGAESALAPPSPAGGSPRKDSTEGRR